MKVRTPLLMRLVVSLYAAGLISGCAATMSNLPPEEPPMHSPSEFAEDEKILYVDDPWSKFNQRMYQFNYYADEYAIYPIVRGYEFITPVFVQEGASNFFNNIGEIKTLYNSILQAKGKKSLNALGRFLTNSTLGILGLFDVATRMGMERQPEDFGQTLGVWGVGTGPYVVLPLFGPNTVRSATGLAVDTAARIAMQESLDRWVDVGYETAIETGLTVWEAIDKRHQIKFRYHKTHYPFEYLFVRYFYRQQQEFAVMK